jgi:hypothetical protein
LVPAQQDTDEASRLNMATPSATGTRGDQSAGKRPIASLFPGIPWYPSVSDAGITATERAPDTACSAGELVTAHAPLPGYKAEGLCALSVHKGSHNTVCASVQNRQSSCRAQQQQQHATFESIPSSYRSRSAPEQKDSAAAGPRSKQLGVMPAKLRRRHAPFAVRKIPSTGLQRVSTSQEPQRTWSAEKTERVCKSLCPQCRRTSPAQEHTVDRR